MKRSKKVISYHGRRGKPYIHTTQSGKRFIMVRKKGSGLKRLYEGSLYYTDRKKSKKRRLKL